MFSFPSPLACERSLKNKLTVGRMRSHLPRSGEKVKYFRRPDTGKGQGEGHAGQPAQSCRKLHSLGKEKKKSVHPPSHPASPPPARLIVVWGVQCRAWPVHLAPPTFPFLLFILPLPRSVSISKHPVWYRHACLSERSRMNFVSFSSP